MKEGPTRVHKDVAEVGRGGLDSLLCSGVDVWTVDKAWAICFWRAISIL